MARKVIYKYCTNDIDLIEVGDSIYEKNKK